MSILVASQKFQHDLGNVIFKIYLKMEKQKALRARRKRLTKALKAWEIMKLKCKWCGVSGHDSSEAGDACVLALSKENSRLSLMLRREHKRAEDWKKRAEGK